MRWKKRGVIFDVAGASDWMVHHAQLPVVRVRDARMNVYFASRDGQGRSRIGVFETDPDEPASVRRLRPDPVLGLGTPGAFDDSGVMPSCLVEVDGRLLLYYVGWTTSVKARHRTAIGLAISDDNGATFRRALDGAIAGLAPDDSPGASTCFVIHEEDEWRMWFTSTIGWVDIRGHAEELYVIRYAESRDGLGWQPTDTKCIGQRTPTEAIGRPWVLPDGAGYRMWFSFRDADGFRQDPRRSYRIGYAESSDGMRWRRRDETVGIDLSLSGWDSEMIAYPCVYEHRGVLHLLYNGNGFGASGLGHAVLDTRACQD